MSSLIWPSLGSMTSGLPRPSHTARSFEFRPPLVHPIRRGTALFKQTNRGKVRLEVRSVEHQLVRRPAASGKGGEDLVEYAEPAPADEAVVDRLVPAIRRRRIPLPQVIPDHEDDPADHSAVFYASNPVQKRKIWLDLAHLRLRKPDQTVHHEISRCQY